MCIEQCSTNVHYSFHTNGSEKRKGGSRALAGGRKKTVGNNLMKNGLQSH